MPLRSCVVSVVLITTFASLNTPVLRISAQARKADGAKYPSRRLADGKVWMTRNLDADTMQSYCYNDAERNCRGYGRLYTWEAARRACQQLGDEWRLPTDEEWRQFAKLYGGASER
jgi:uncharacterized protein (TIGR02145 family)